MNLRPLAVEITTTRFDRRDLPALGELDQHGERDARVRAVEHAGAIGARGGVGELLLGRLLDDAVEALAACAMAFCTETGLPIWMAEASVGSAVTGSNAQLFLVGEVERVGAGGLRDDDARALA